MRTTITLDADVAAAIDRVRRERSVGLSQAVNELVRAGLVTTKPKREPFVQKTYPMGPALIDVTNVWEAIEAAEGPDAR